MSNLLHPFLAIWVTGLSDEMGYPTFIKFQDLLLTPVYLLLIVAIVYNIRNGLYPIGSLMRKYFTQAFWLKVLGGFGVGMIYQFYYGGGDTFAYFFDGVVINTAFYKDPLLYFEILFSNLTDCTDAALEYYTSTYYYRSANAFFISKITSFAGILSFNTYMVSTIFFGLYAFFGSWKFFTLLVELYPKLHKQFAYAMFWIPSIVFWGSGIFKDTITMSSLLLLVYHFYYLFVKRKALLYHFAMMMFYVFIVLNIRTFFIVILTPCLFLWYFLTIRDRIKNKLVRQISLPILLVISLTIIVFGLGRFAATSTEFSKDSLTQKTQGFQDWHSTQGGSTYNLGTVDFSPAGILRTFPLAVNVTLFRPWPWEVRNALMLLSAAQSLFFLLYTLRVLLSTQIFRFFTLIGSNSLALFSFSFSIMYAFVCGFTSYNFGALDRYKIPCLSFYIISIIMVDYLRKSENRE